MKRTLFGNLIREYRLKKNWTQMQLAQALGYETPQFISLIERDQSKVPINVLGQLIVLLGIPEDEVVKRLVKSFQDEILTQINKGKKLASSARS